MNKLAKDPLKAILNTLIKNPNIPTELKKELNLVNS